MFGIPMVPRVVSGGCGEVTATRTIRYSRNDENGILTMSVFDFLLDENSLNNY